MPLECSVIYKKDFSDPHEGLTPEAVRQWEKAKRAYAHAEPTFVTLTESLRRVLEAQQYTPTESTEGSVRRVTLSVGKHKIVSAELAPPVPKESQPYGLRELYVQIDVDELSAVPGLKLDEVTEKIEGVLVYGGCTSRGDLEVPRENFF